MMVDYKCKYCGRPGAVECEDGDSTMFQVKKWKPMLACNRCADFMDQKFKLFDKIKTVCVFLVQSASLRGEKASKIEALAREKLTSITQRLSALACNHYHLQTIWDIEFVNMLIDKPEKWSHVANHFIRSIKSQSESQHAAKAKQQKELV